MFTLLQNYIPTAIFSIVKKRGVATLQSGNPGFPDPPPTVNPAYVCDDATVCTPTLPTITQSGGIDCMVAGGGSVVLTAHCGVGGYTWSTTAGQLSSSFGVSVTLIPATNSGGSVLGNAYRRLFLEASCGSPNSFALLSATFKCDDSYNSSLGIQTIASCTDANPCPTTCPDTFFDALGLGDFGMSSVQCANGTCDNPSACGGALFGFTPSPCPSTDVARYTGSTVIEDLRTPQMIADGCNPCGSSMSAGAVVTVTDALGQSAFVTINIE